MRFTESLRFRLLVPLLVAGLLASTLVAWLSYRTGSRAAEQQMRTRVAQLTDALRPRNYPLSGSVIRLLSELTDTELIAVDSAGGIIDSTLKTLSVPPADGELVREGGSTYRCRVIDVTRYTQPGDRAARLAILLDLREVREATIRATILPLATAVIVLLIMSLVWFTSTSRLVKRIRRLQSRFAEISDGQFTRPVGSLEPTDSKSDEIGILAASAQTMADRLDRLWNQVHRQQGERIMHQVAAGMAHQLRNSLTGARIAIELEARESSDCPPENLSVALTQIEQSEHHVQQLLMLASGKLAGAVPMKVGHGFDKVQSTTAPVAKHRRCALTWSIDEGSRDATVSEGSTWIAAISNLIHNAMDAGDHVEVRVTRHGDRVTALVEDDGPGVPPAIANELYQPFVTTKPEGLGLGLAVAHRAAETLGGRLRYRRIDRHTQFEFECPTES